MFYLNPVGFCSQYILRIWTGGAHYSGRRKTRTPYKTIKSGEQDRLCQSFRVPIFKDMGVLSLLVLSFVVGTPC